ncbi:MAG TPA: SRPBCC domain-containing protein, partial [Puia sp.]|nr:SRPBCC domain-containing protein [Puia sp.]
MSQPLLITNSIRIHAPASKVWNALTNPQETKKYMFGCEALSDWKEGSPLIWKGNFNGVELIAVKGTIKKI